jgi:protein-histidine pros-kinase
MGLMGMFNLIFLITVGLSVAVDYFAFSSFFADSAQKEVLEHARLILRTAMSVRSYTEDQIQPIITQLDPQERHFYPQRVPSYAAVESFKYLHAEKKEYSYREAALNPTNPRDKADPWEADIINLFRADPSRKEYWTVRTSAAGKSLVLAQPLVAKAECLVCHDTPARAPASLVRQYSASNGFNWKANEIIGAQILSVPTAFPEQVAGEALRRSLFLLLGVAALTLVVMNVMLMFFVLQPVRRLATRAGEISRGDLEVPELTVSGRNEISTLATSFNRMHRSLKGAMKALNSGRH